MERLVKFVQLSAADRWLLLEVAVLLGVARLVILTVPFRRIASHLGVHMVVTPETPTPEHIKLLSRVHWAVETAARHVPWEAMCLPQAIAAKVILNRRGVMSTLYLGVMKDKGLRTHAWLRAGETIVTGQREMQQFTVISTFA